MPTNFLDPFFSVVIKGMMYNYCLTTTKIINDDIPVIHKYYPIASSININVGLSYINECEINLAPDINSWWEILESDCLNIGNKVYITYGYRNPRSVRYFVGQILSIPSVSFGESPSFKIPVTGVAFKGLLDKSGIETTSNYNGKKFSEIIKEFARRNGLTSVKEEYSKELADKIIDKYPVEGSEWQKFIKFLSEYNCTAYQFEETLVVMDFNKMFTDPPKIKLVWGGNVDIGSNVYPLNSFEANTQGVFLPQDIYLAETFVSKYNDAIMKLSVNSPQLKLTEFTGLDVKSIFKTKYERDNFGNDEDKMMALMLPDYFEGDIRKATMQYLLNERASRVFEATATTLGNVDLLPGIIVEIAGMGTLFNGKYCVFSVTHRIDSKGFYTDLEIKKNAFAEVIDATRNVNVNKSEMMFVESDVINKEIKEQ